MIKGNFGIRIQVLLKGKPKGMAMNSKIVFEGDQKGF